MSRILPVRPGLGEESRPGGDARRAGGAESRSHTNRARSRRPRAPRPVGSPRARPRRQLFCPRSPTAARRRWPRRARGREGGRGRYPPNLGARRGPRAGRWGAPPRTGLPRRNPRCCLSASAPAPHLQGQRTKSGNPWPPDQTSCPRQQCF